MIGVSGLAKVGFFSKIYDHVIITNTYTVNASFAGILALEVAYFNIEGNGTQK